MNRRDCMTLVFDTEDSEFDKKRYYKIFPNSSAEGYVSSRCIRTPIIFIDVKKNFRIDETQCVNKEKILQHFINYLNIFPYITSVYNLYNIQVRNNFETAPYAFDILFKTTQELLYIIQNYYELKHNHVVFCCFGKYKEYNYVFNALLTQLKQNSDTVNIDFIRLRHFANYFDDNNALKTEILFNDIIKLDAFIKKIEFGIS